MSHNKKTRILESTKTRLKIPQLTKVRAELQKENHSECPFCHSTEVGHFEIHHIDENPSNNERSNLILLCSTCHSKITKGDFSQLEVLRKKVSLLNEIDKITSDKQSVNFNAKVGTAIVGSNNTISIKTTKSAQKSKYPEGCIGFDIMKANYISHLIGRYNEYKEYEVGKGNVKYGVFPASLKKEFKIGPTRTIYNLSIDRFDELVLCIQNRINRTMLAKMNGKAHKNYASFEEYKELKK